MSNDNLKPANSLAPKMKDTAILIGWIAGLLLIAGLVWYFTQPLRNNTLIKAVNKVLEQNNDLRRLHLSENSAGKSSGIGSWFSIFENSKLREGSGAYVFVFIAEGSFFPCAAIVSPKGNVEEFIPLNSHGRRMIKRIPAGILSLYASRIEGLKP